MSSADKGKDIALRWIRENIKAGGYILDVGACDGKYGKMLNHDYTVDAVEVFEPNVERHNLCDIYDLVFVRDVRQFEYGCIATHGGVDNHSYYTRCRYDLVIFGDVLEHMTEAEAIKVLDYAKEHSGAILVAVPFMWVQDAIYGNPYEKHIQDKLTHERFMELYKGFEPLVVYPNYGYYVWKYDEKSKS